MTHDELLALLKPMTNDDAIFMKDALRAVVELHKPIEGKCNLCAFTLYITPMGIPYEHTYTTDYPCATIKAIEKELQ